MIRRRLSKRKHLWLKIFGDLFLWLIWGGVVLLISPDNHVGVALFFSSLFGAVWLLGMTITNHLRRSLLIALLLICFLLLRFYSFDELVNLGLLAGLLLTIELMFVVS